MSETPKTVTPVVGLIEKNLSTEAWREYDFGGRTYRITFPCKLFYREGGSTHRVVTSDGVVHCVPAPGVMGCVLRWMNHDPDNPCNF
jgi:hypothetical protein